MHASNSLLLPLVPQHTHTHTHTYTHISLSLYLACWHTLLLDSVMLIDSCDNTPVSEGDGHCFLGVLLPYDDSVQPLHNCSRRQPTLQEQGVWASRGTQQGWMTA